MTSPCDPQSLPDEERAGELINRMYIIKDVRARTLQLEKVKVAVLEQYQLMKSEEDRIHDYKNELELLEQEKLAHVEELRQIHSDMKAMEEVIKGANDDRTRSMELASEAFKEYSALKSEIDNQRVHLGLGVAPPLAVGETVLSKQYFKKMRSRISKEAKFESSVELVEPLALKVATPAPGYSSDNRPTTSSSLRSRDPPMKICQSCQQSIHRNAPVCPLCKAKSRSRQPKRTKRLLEEDTDN